MSHKFNADSRAKTRCYIINNDTNKKMTFQFNPTSMPYSRSANYVDMTSPGRSYPKTQYTSGNAREFSFEVFYYDKPCTGKIKEALKFLEELLPPEKNTASFTRPPSFTLAYGYFVKNYVLKQLDVNDEWLDENGNQLMTRFTLSVRQVSS